MEKNIENGIVYEIRKGETYKEKILLGNEFSLKTSVAITKSDTTTIIQGILYKEDYTGEMQPIENPIEVRFGDYSKTTVIQPVNGMVDLSIEIPSEIKRIGFMEQNTEIVYGSLEVE